jgi:DNA-binding response OmpR family regulator
MTMLLTDTRPGLVIATPKDALAGVFAHWALERGHLPLVCRDERTVELAASRPNTALIVLDHTFDREALAICRRVTDVFLHARRLLYVAEDPLLEEQALMAGADAFCALIPGDAHAAGIVFSRAARLLHRTYLERTHQPITSELRQGPITIDFSILSAFVEGEPLALTWTEFRLLVYFVFRPNRLISALELETVVLDNSRGSVRSQVTNLLEKLGSARDRFRAEQDENYRYVFDEPMLALR